MNYKTYVQKNNININRKDKDFDLCNLVTEARIHAGISQSELARRMGTKQSNISRAESGKIVPGISFLKEVAKAVNASFVFPKFSFITKEKTKSNNIDEELNHVKTVSIPLVGNIACGLPVLAEENVEELIQVSSKLIKQGFKYFLLKAKGDSMNMAGINDGDVVLVKQQSIANNGDRVVALINEEATLKEFHVASGVIVLKPISKNKKHKPIIVDKDFQVQGVVTAVISGLNG
jgi:repressor LexA